MTSLILFHLHNKSIYFGDTTLGARWRNVVELRQTYPHADLVTVKSGRKVIVLNAAGNKYRMVVAMHFNRQTVYTLRFMTHAEYSKGDWKSEL